MSYNVTHTLSCDFCGNDISSVPSVNDEFQSIVDKCKDVVIGKQMVWIELHGFACDSCRLKAEKILSDAADQILRRLATHADGPTIRIPPV